MIYFIITMFFFLIVAYVIYYRYTILSKIFLSTQLVKLGVYARLYNFFVEKTSKENASLFAEILNDQLFSEETGKLIKMSTELFPPLPNDTKSTPL